MTLLYILLAWAAVSLPLGMFIGRAMHWDLNEPASGQAPETSARLSALSSPGAGR